MDEWIAAVKAELGVDAAVDLPTILDVAKVAAHSIERPAAPVTTFLLGIAVANGMDAAEASRRITDLAAAWPTA